MDLMQLAPVPVIGLAIIVTQFYKNAGFINPDFSKKTVWLPSLVVGIIGAILLGYGTKAWNLIAWDAICYAGASTYAVLIAKRVVK